MRGSIIITQQSAIDFIQSIVRFDQGICKIGGRSLPTSGALRLFKDIKSIGFGQHLATGIDRNALRRNGEEYYAPHFATRENITSRSKRPVQISQR